ncbi:hypothetical protein EI424_13525 [Tenacibaculum singaporense]|nr:hypothetical protein EI424_13525 [Tenacibaculum singaporense]
MPKENTRNTTLFSLFIALLLIVSSGWSQNQAQDNIKLSFSDGRTDVIGVASINSVLRTVGVRVSTVNLPEEAKPILKTSSTRALNKEEADKLISIFYLDRKDLLDQIEKAGRKPEAHRGGYLSTKEEEMSPYPKVYDMKALSPEVTVFLQDKFGKLHVNSSDNGMGIDEVMTIVSGGPWTWFFVLPNNVVGKLTLGHVGINDLGWRISYPGLGPHGGYLDAEYGLVVAFAHGPEKFVMRYEEPTVKLSKWMGKNPWIDFSGDAPKLLERSSQIKIKK